MILEEAALREEAARQEKTAREEAGREETARRKAAAKLEDAALSEAAARRERTARENARRKEVARNIAAAKRDAVGRPEQAQQAKQNIWQAPVHEIESRLSNQSSSEVNACTLGRLQHSTTQAEGKDRGQLKKQGLKKLTNCDEEPMRTTSNSLSSMLGNGGTMTARNMPTLVP